VTEPGSDTLMTGLARLISGAQVARMISVAAQLRIADLLEDGPRRCDELAAVTETRAPSLFRLLRALASVGIFAEKHDGRFGPCAPTSCSRETRVQSTRGFAGESACPRSVWLG
jgi:hypothetical protein